MDPSAPVGTKNWGLCSTSKRAEFPTGFRDAAGHPQVVLVQLLVLDQLLVLGSRTLCQGRGLFTREGLAGHGCF